MSHTQTYFRRFFLALITIVLFAILQTTKIAHGNPYPSNATFITSELLGRPTDTTITVNLLAIDDLEVYFEYGTKPGIYTGRTTTTQYSGGIPIEAVISGLKPNTRYYYRMRYHQPGETVFQARDAHSFHTQRYASSTFTFAVQADPHIPLAMEDENTASMLLYENELGLIAADNPDFLIDLGDTFFGDRADNYQDAYQSHLDQRPYFDIIGHSSPLFLVLGNHEGERGWDLDGTSENIAVWATTARKLLYPNPLPDGFYSGNSISEPYVGLRENYYAWEWGDALFVVLDPFWHTNTKPDRSGDRWDWTLGKDQYDWLKTTLEQSNATFKFVFSHHVTGGLSLDGPLIGRGGIEAASHNLGGDGSFEWGGENADGSWGFADQRAGWAMPIHQLMVANNVTIFFHGHDHLFAKQQLDGIIYQECPKSADETYGLGSIIKGGYVYGDMINNSGYLRVTVSSVEVKVEYLRAYLDGDGTNGEMAYTYTIPAPFVHTGSLEGTISDADSGAPISNAEIIIDDGKGLRASYTDSNGFYHKDLPTGVYTVTINAQTYISSTYSGIFIQPESTIVQNIDLVYDPQPRIAISPVAQIFTGKPGTEVAHTFSIHNTGNLSDTYNLSLSDNQWSTTASPTVGPLYPGEISQVEVLVSIPSALNINGILLDQDNFTLTAHSNFDSNISEQANGTTQVFINPDIVLSPAENTIIGKPGEVISHEFSISNTGDYTDTFILQVSGQTWEVTAPISVGPLKSGEIAVINLSVAIPQNLDIAADEFTLTAISGLDEEIKVAAQGKTIASYPAVSLTPSFSVQNGSPGEVVTHTFTLTNTGDYTDTFTISLSENSWYADAVSNLGPLVAGDSMSFPVWVMIPHDLGQTDDEFKLTARSKLDEDVTASALGNTKTSIPGVFLSLSPPVGIAKPGQVVTYTLQLTNTGNYTDTFFLTVNGNWESSLSVDNINSLASGESAIFWLQVEVPLHAADSDVEITSIKAISNLYPNLYAEALSTTIVSWYRTYLPLLQR